ncbi:hypothetical protein Clacol_005102 [Clathrus columnatus]|uniref:Uncharacterized protein n=1 Tax=Clathrus columnatus TaxID=1419009 RepID=A0AAV5A8C6_9AGAM|nr:hypothetical protein Clacol_005102 [Clathrus columnatus]
MSESNKESGVGGFVSSSTQLPEERQGGEASRDNEKTESQSMQELRPVPPPDQYDEDHGNKQEMKRQGEEVDHESSPVLFLRTTSESRSTLPIPVINWANSRFVYNIYRLNTLELQDVPRHTYTNQQPRPRSTESEVRSAVKSSRVLMNEMEPGQSYSLYPTSDTRTGDSEPIQLQRRLGLTGPGLSKAVLSRGRIWETERFDGWESRNDGERNREFMPPTSTSSSPYTDTKERERKRGENENEEDRSSTSRRSIPTASVELALPVSKVREDGEEYPYSTPFAATSIHRSREDTAVTFSTTNPSASTQTSSSISRAEENPSTPPVPRARNESVSDSSSALAISHPSSSSKHTLSQNRYSPNSMSKRLPSPLDSSVEYREERRKQQSWIAADTPSSSRNPSYRQDDSIPSRPGTSSRTRGTSMITPPDTEDSSYHHSRSHVSRSPDLSYFQNASSSKSGTTNTNTNITFQGSMTYHSQQDPFKQQQYCAEPSSHPSSKYSRIQSDHGGRPSSSLHTSSHSRSGPDNIGIERSYSQGYSGKDLNVGRRFVRSNPSVEDNRSHEPRVGRSTSATPPTPDNKDTLKQRTPYVEYQRTVPPRQDERSAEGRKPIHDQENSMLDSTSGPSVGLYSVLKGVRAGPSPDVNTNLPPSKATSSYSTPSTTSVSLSPVLSKSLPSLRETFASPTISTESLPPPPSSHTINSVGTTSGRQQTVTIPPAQTPSRAIPGGPWLYDGEEPDLEEDDGANVADEAGRPKKRRRTRVALSCAGQPSQSS